MAVNAIPKDLRRKGIQLLNQQCWNWGRDVLRPGCLQCFRPEHPEPGQVLLQTWSTDPPAILHAQAHDYASFAAEELDKRRKHDNPPIGYLALIRISGEQRHRVDARAQTIADRARMLAERR